MLRGICAKKNLVIADRKVVEYCTKQNRNQGCIWLRLIVDAKEVNRENGRRKKVLQSLFSENRGHRRP